MANILINALKSRTGGGKNILDNFIAILNKNETKHAWFVFTPDSRYYKKYETENVFIMDVRIIYKYNVLFPWLYFFEFPYYIKKLKIDAIINFGDVIIPGFYNQVYYFDWAYAVYPDAYIWKNMSFTDYLMRKAKVLLIQKDLHQIRVVIAQTDNISDRLIKRYGLKDVLIVPTPVSISNAATNNRTNFMLPKATRKFLYPASFSSHKNFDVIISLGKIIVNRALPFTLVLTININSQTKDFFREIDQYDLDCIISVGELDSGMMPSLYEQCDALLLPSLLESYGLPYVEAMTYGLPIVTSDLDFAHAICGDIAYYFNPFEANSILNAMELVFKDEDVTQNRIKAAKEKIASMPDWQEVFNIFQKQIDRMLE
ncbi:MAG: glycosyltransferase [Bacteroidetes bacterium]|nr:glycosyltransferase [Bacteroidota bacterium]